VKLPGSDMNKSTSMMMMHDGSWHLPDERRGEERERERVYIYIYIYIYIKSRVKGAVKKKT